MRYQLDTSWNKNKIQKDKAETEKKTQENAEAQDLQRHTEIDETVEKTQGKLQSGNESTQQYLSVIRKPCKSYRKSLEKFQIRFC